jgi:1-acyl-sn-glycerol-3-phosphate acyltransferase
MLIRRFRALLALLAFGVFFGLVIIPSFLVLRAWLKMREATPSEVRRALASFNIRYWAYAFRVVAPVAGLQVRFTGDWPCFGASPRIFLSNHCNLADALVYAYCLASVNAYNTRMIAKAELQNWPMIGWFTRDNGYALVTRDKRKRAAGVSDVDVVRAAGALAHAEHANFGLFPEGSRFRGPKPGARRRHVGDPKPGGFAALCETMPFAHVVVMTFKWEGGSGGATLGAIDSWVDKTVEVHWKREPPVEADHALLFLERMLDEMEERLSS